MPCRFNLRGYRKRLTVKKMRGTNLASCFSGVEDGIGYYASKLATSRPSPPLATGAFPKFESVCDTIFLLYSRLRTSSRGHITKKVLLPQDFQTLGGRWCFYTTSKNLSTSIYRPFCPLFLPIWSHIGLSKKMPYICKGNRNF